MTLTTAAVQHMFMTARRNHSMRSSRSQQRQERRIGASELGHCRSFLYYMMTEAPFDDETDAPDQKLAAFVGSAYGDRMEDAFIEEYPGSVKQVEFETTFPSGRVIPGHADLVDQDNNCVYDVKTKAGLELIRGSEGPSRQYKYQIATYLLGLIQTGVLEEGAQAFLVYSDRSGKDPWDHVQEVVLDEWLIREIDEFVGDAVYAVQNLIPADQVPKDQNYDFCASYCPFFSTCRGGDTLAEGTADTEDNRLALKVYLEGKEMESAGKKMKDAGAEVLRQTQGMVIYENQPYEVSQTIIGASSYTVDRKESVRLNIRKRK